VLHLIDSCLDFDLNFLFKEKHNISETISVTVLKQNVGEEPTDCVREKGILFEKEI
jgi:hypothetical protein